MLTGMGQGPVFCLFSTFYDGVTRGLTLGEVEVLSQTDGDPKAEAVWAGLNNQESSTGPHGASE